MLFIELSIYQRILKKIIINQHNVFNIDKSCDTEDRSNDKLCHHSNKLHFKIYLYRKQLTLNCNNISQDCCFYCDQINEAFASMSDWNPNGCVFFLLKKCQLYVFKKSNITSKNHN